MKFTKVESAEKIVGLLDFLAVVSVTILLIAAPDLQYSLCVSGIGFYCTCRISVK